MNPSDPLAGPLARLDRAKFHLDDLLAADKQFLRSHPEPYTLSVQPDEAQRRHVVRVHVHRNPPERLGFVAGDFVHNCRAALDNLIWALAPKRVRQRKPSFPIYNDPLRFECEARPMLKGMDPRVVEAIEWCQPYAKHLTRPGRLIQLRDLWNFDKHRAPLAVACAPHIASYFTFDDRTDRMLLHARLGEVLEDGKEIAWIDIDPSAESNVRPPRFRFFIAFVGGRERPIPDFGLEVMYGLVREGIIPAIRQAL